MVSSVTVGRQACSLQAGAVRASAAWQHRSVATTRRFYKCRAASLSSVDMPKDYADESVRQSEEGNATSDLRGAPEWVKLTAIFLTSALVAGVEFLVCKRA
jgi:hypothetical protein